MNLVVWDGFGITGHRHGLHLRVQPNTRDVKGEVRSCCLIVACLSLDGLSPTTMDTGSDDEGPPELVESGSHVPLTSEPHDIGKKVPITIVTGV